MKRLGLCSAVALFISTASCSALGPKANVSVVNPEVNQTTEVGNIIIANITGIDATGNAGKAYLASAMRTYGTRSRSISAISTRLNTVGAPKGMGQAVLAEYQVRFARMVEKWGKNGKKKSLRRVHLTQPKKSSDVPKSLKDAKGLIAKLKDESSKLENLGDALVKGNIGKMFRAMKEAHAAMPVVRIVNRVLFDELGATYVLLSHVIGDENVYERGKEVTLATALVNLKTGHLRYFGSSSTEKGVISTPFMAILAMMSNNLFEQASELAPFAQ